MKHNFIKRKTKQGAELNICTNCGVSGNRLNKDCECKPRKVKPLEKYLQ